jgi:O-antigen/teichoic acid export membrane protein
LATVTVARDALRGTIVLFLGNAASTVVFAIVAIITARLLGPDQYGIYTLVLLIPNILYLFVGFGVTSAITRFPAYYLAKGDKKRAVQFTSSAIIFLVIFGLAMTIVTVLLSGNIGIVIFHRQGLGFYVEIASLSIFGQTLLLSSVAALVGWNSMTLASASLISQALLKLVLVVGLILFGFGVSGALLGYFGSFIVSGFGAIFFLVFTTMKLKLHLRNHYDLFADVKEMLSYGLPLYVGNVANGFSLQLITVIVAIVASNVVVGEYQAAYNVTLALSILGSALGSSLGRSFSALDGSEGDISMVFRLSVKYVGIFVTPLILFIVPTAGELMDLLYGTTYINGSIYLEILALSYVPLCIGLSVLGPYFSGIAKSRFAMYFFLTNAAVIFGSLPIFVYLLNYGVVGTIFSLALGNLASSGVGLYLAKKNLATQIDFRSSIGVLLASSLASGFVFLTVSTLAFINVGLAMSIQLVILVASYSLLAPIVGAIDHNDVRVLSSLLENHRSVKKGAKFFLAFEEALIEMKDKILRKDL